MSKEQFIIKASLKWARINEATGTNAMSGKYQVDLHDLSKDDIEKLKFLGIAVKEKEGQTFVTAKAAKPVDVVGKDRSPIANAKLGNGTKANVLVRPYEWEFKGKSGIGLGLQAIQVVELVEYKAGVDAFDNLAGSDTSTDHIAF